MGVYIKGMEMPKDDCTAYKSVVISNYFIDGEMKILAHDDITGAFIGEVVDVPEPHGRLIDADARVNVQVYNDEFEDFQTVNMSIDDLLDSSWIELEDDSTIIPAEEGKRDRH